MAGVVGRSLIDGGLISKTGSTKEQGGGVHHAELWRGSGRRHLGWAQGRARVGGCACDGANLSGWVWVFFFERESSASRQDILFMGTTPLYSF
jgi:hypothetical protein